MLATADEPKTPDRILKEYVCHLHSSRWLPARAIDAIDFDKAHMPPYARIAVLNAPAIFGIASKLRSEALYGLGGPCCKSRRPGPSGFAILVQKKRLVWLAYVQSQSPFVHRTGAKRVLTHVCTSRPRPPFPQFRPFGPFWTVSL